MNLDDFDKLTTIASDMSLPTDTKTYIENLFAGKTMQEIQLLDPIAEWEKAMGGKNYKLNSDIDNMTMLGFVSVFNSEKTALLKSFKETNISTTFEEFMQMMKDHNFKIAYKNTYKGYAGNETEVILYDDKNGLIIYANSFGKSLNSATIYGEIGPAGYSYQPGDEKIYPEVKELFDTYQTNPHIYGDRSVETFINDCIVRAAGAPARSSNGPISGHPNNYTFDFDMREGAIAKLEKLQTPNKLFRCNPVWKGKERFLWLRNSSDNDQDYKVIANKKIATSPELVRIVNDPARFKGLISFERDDDVNAK